MTMLWAGLTSFLLLAAVGWWIGSQFVRRDLHEEESKLHIAVQPGMLDDGGTGKRLQQALREAGLTPDRVMLGEDAPDNGQYFLLERLTDRDQHTWYFRANTIRPTDFALQSIRVAEATTDREEAAALAKLISWHTGQPVGGRQAWPTTMRFERHYLSAWAHLRTENPAHLREAHRALSSALAAWPEDRQEEKSVALANLAWTCLHVPEAGPSSLPRVLEGLDAAKAALRLSYDYPPGTMMTGLREVMVELRDAIKAEKDGGQFSPQSSSSGPARGQPNPNNHMQAMGPV